MRIEVSRTLVFRNPKTNQLITAKAFSDPIKRKPQGPQTVPDWVKQTNEYKFALDGDLVREVAAKPLPKVKKAAPTAPGLSA